VGATIGLPSDEIKRMSEATIAGLERVLETMKPGVPCGDVAEAWADAIVKSGFDRPHKRAGYSIGISFPPELGRGAHPQLELWREAGARARDDFPRTILDSGRGVALVGNSEAILVTDRGSEALTRFPRQHFVK
jgi:ectoine hydrolase